MKDDPVYVVNCSKSIRNHIMGHSIVRQPTTLPRAYINICCHEETACCLSLSCPMLGQMNCCFMTARPVLLTKRFVTCFSPLPGPYIPFTDINSDCPTRRAHFVLVQKYYFWPEVCALLQHPRVTQLGNTTLCKYQR